MEDVAPIAPQLQDPEKAREFLEVVCETAHMITDSSTVLDATAMGIGRKHDKVNHLEKEYVRYEDGLRITTNAVEGHFAALKRGTNGVYHHVASAICTAI